MTVMVGEIIVWSELLFIFTSAYNTMDKMITYSSRLGNVSGPVSGERSSHRTYKSVK